MCKLVQITLFIYHSLTKNVNIFPKTNEDCYNLKKATIRNIFLQNLKENNLHTIRKKILQNQTKLLVFHFFPNRSKYLLQFDRELTAF